MNQQIDRQYDLPVERPHAGVTMIAASNDAYASKADGGSPGTVISVGRAPLAPCPDAARADPSQLTILRRPAFCVSDRHAAVLGRPRACSRCDPESALAASARYFDAFAPSAFGRFAGSSTPHEGSSDGGSCSEAAHRGGGRRPAVCAARLTCVHVTRRRARQFARAHDAQPFAGRHLAGVVS